jgi:GT2 family glycosyltransferase
MRPPCDVVVPFAGSAAGLRALVQRLGALDLGDRDTVTVVDNRAPTAAAAPPAGTIQVLAAGDVRSSYYARNRGAARGTSPWLVFVDADVEPRRDLLDAYFEPPPDERVGVLAGGVVDAAPVRGDTLAGRYAVWHGMLSVESTRQAGFAYAKTANCAVRRRAFEQVGGFAEVRSGGDADLCFRIERAGWTLGWREHASVRHRSRGTVPGLLRQAARHGAGTAWLERRYPGFLPGQSRARVAAWLALEAARSLRLAAARRDDALLRVLHPLTTLAYELGRSLPNRPRRTPR